MFTPFQELIRLQANGTAKPSFLASHLEMLGQEGYDEDDSIDIVKGAAVVISFAGAETVGNMSFSRFHD